MVGDIKKFVDKIVLFDVFLRSQTGVCRVFPRSLDPSKVDLTFDFNAGFEKNEKDKILLAVLALKVIGCDKETKEVRFDLVTEYVLAYSYQEYDEEISDELFHEFTRTTALFNAYPYLRESVQSMSSKMGIPPVVAPLLKIEPPKTASASKLETTQEATLVHKNKKGRKSK